jgi:hypothetical protein
VAANSGVDGKRTRAIPRGVVIGFSAAGAREAMPVNFLDGNTPDCSDYSITYC